MSQDPKIIKRALSIKLYFEGPSDWTTRELIDIVDEYFMERLPVMINNALEPYGMEASILEDKTACEILGETPSCKNTLVIALYVAGTSKPAYYAIYRYRKGDNTYEFFLENLVQA
ncbi:hypothetical protein Smar_1180 [Staphylothermus marinus F1]|uniref:Uncharacterized protein n=1 Tax=Staphylothermus marinus (strain ATCC 43588 / DSM 3639 / JCM 9404 / F1) TaxID=399550 RepID=A3DNR5_STAMF|nr:hypothetical protein [Staphylothermus marinus]ABN70275.1 hypothetical protein Smar_1180 [Staphylothermus marinus F1]